LEAEKGGVFAESPLWSSAGVFIRPVEDGLGVGFFGEQDVVQDTSDLACRCGDGLRGSKLGAHTLEGFPLARYSAPIGGQQKTNRENKTNIDEGQRMEREDGSQWDIA
jgi:hypothetical protein